MKIGLFSLFEQRGHRNMESVSGVRWGERSKGYCIKERDIMVYHVSFATGRDDWLGLR